MNESIDNKLQLKKIHATGVCAEENGKFFGASSTSTDNSFRQELRTRTSVDSELAKAVTINILDFNYLNQTKNYHSVFHLYEDEERFSLTEALEMQTERRNPENG